jgi:hypothetical protein
MRPSCILLLVMSVVIGASGCELVDDPELDSSSQEIVECPSIAKEGVSYYYPPPDDCDGGGGGGGSPPPPPPAPLFRSSVGLGGAGAIRDLKIEKGGSSSQTPLVGYTLIPLDLNKGAGGTYIYLTFTRLETYVQEHIPAGCAIAPGPYVTAIRADDYNAIDALGVKGKCLQPGYLPVVEATWSSLDEWKHPDLNDGAGGRYIFAWQEKGPYSPIAEVGVIAGSSSSIACPAGWNRIDQDLNQGAGGDWIYFCYRY